MDNNFYTVSKKINGVTYKAQFNGISAMLEATDRTYIDGTNITSSVKMAKYLFENVLVEPTGLTPDSFQSMEDFSAVTEFLQEVMQGNFRDKADRETAKK